MALCSASTPANGRGGHARSATQGECSKIQPRAATKRPRDPPHSARPVSSGLVPVDHRPRRPRLRARSRSLPNVNSAVRIFRDLRCGPRWRPAGDSGTGPQVDEVRGLAGLEIADLVSSSASASAPARVARYNKCAAIEQHPLRRNALHQVACSLPSGCRNRCRRRRRCRARSAPRPPHACAAGKSRCPAPRCCRAVRHRRSRGRQPLQFGRLGMDIVRHHGPRPHQAVPLVTAR